MKSVLLIDHYNDHEADFRLMRLMEWGGFALPHFSRFTLDPAKDQAASWQEAISNSTVLFPMGNDATTALIGRGNLDQTRGYIWQAHNRHCIPSIHPYVIQRGKAKLSAAFINDIQKAVRLAMYGLPPQLVDYTLDPLPYAALEWARTYLRALAADPTIRLAFDIETPGKGEEEDGLDTDGDAPDRTWNIERIGFAYRDLHALSIPWEPSYMAAIHAILGSAGDKVVWNAGFDVPRIRRSGVPILGTIHDGMVAWHILHTDLPKRLGFVATFVCPWQPAWKHLSGARPAFYNATDADVEQRAMAVIDAELRRAGLWDVYQRDVLDLDPILVHMQSHGMPVDFDIRLDRAIKLQALQEDCRATLESAIPLAARKIEKIFVNTPKDTNGLLTRKGTRFCNFCSVCGARKPRKDHFKRFVKKVNPCADGQIDEREVEVDEFYRLADFSPSRDQLIRYHQHLGRNLPMVWDKKAGRRKISFGERQILDLQGKFPLDSVYPLVIQYRKIDKIAGTYIGRVVDE